jgi:3-methyladenine DNA glycosylase/8-oxoguanine DNA glycosylase
MTSGDSGAAPANPVAGVARTEHEASTAHTATVAAPTDRGGYAFDPVTAVAYLRARDQTLAGLINRVGPFEMGINPAPTTFAMLTEALVYQQLSARAAATIHHRLCRTYGDADSVLRAGDILGIDPQKLREVGLSGAKTLAVIDLALKVDQRMVASIDELAAMSDAEIVTNLVAVRGIGPWTAQMFLIFRLGRPDVLPADDLGIRKGVALTYNLPDMPDSKELARRGHQWRPYRTVAAWYLWQALELAKEHPTDNQR